MATEEGIERSVFVDSNVFLRYLTNDIPERASAAEELFRRAAAGEVLLVTSSMVVAELVWVMESYYGLSRDEVQLRALSVLRMEGLESPEAEILTEALFAYVEKNVDFVDAYNACWMRERGLTRVATYDRRHLARFAGLSIEPLGERI